MARVAERSLARLELLIRLEFELEFDKDSGESADNETLALIRSADMEEPSGCIDALLLGDTAESRLELCDSRS